jgi:hypothetical protein
LQVMARDGHLVSVEANGALVPILRTALFAHADGRATTLIHASVSTEATAFVSVSESNLSSRLAAFGIQVPTLSLSAIAAQVDFRKFALVSDTEGAETSFIFNPGEFDGCTRMVIELHDSSHNSRRVTSAEMAEEIQRQGFSLVDRRGNVCAFTRQPAGRGRA